MSYIEESLSRDEEIQHLFKLHWFSKIYLFIGIILLPFTLFLSAFFVIYEWLRLRSIEQGVTNKRVILKTGIISRKTEEMKLTSIETVEIHQSIVGRIFGFGNVRVTGRGISDVIYKGIDDPLDVKRKIESISIPIN